MTENEPASPPADEPGATSADTESFDQPAPASQESLAWPLRRHSSERIIAGVCAGIARTYAIDPILVRVLAGITVFFGGLGIALYILAWILMPKEDGYNALNSRDGTGKAVLAWIGLLISAAIAVGITSELSFGVKLGLVAALLIGLYLRNQQRSPRSGLSSVEPETFHAVPANSVDATPPMAVPFAATPSHSPAIALKPEPSPVNRGLFFIGLIGLGGIWLANMYGLLTTSWSQILGFGTVLCGIAVLASAWWGRAVWAGVLGFLLIFTSASIQAGQFVAREIQVNGNFSSDDFSAGDMTWKPGSIEELEDSYRLGMGTGVLDLRDIPADAFEEDTELNIDMSVGDLTVYLPEGLHTTVNFSAAAGAISINGDEIQAGIRVDMTSELSPQTSAAQLNLTISTRAGEVNVIQPKAASSATTDNTQADNTPSVEENA